MGDPTLDQVRGLAGEKGYLRSHLELGLKTSGGCPIYHLGAGLSVMATALSARDPGYSKFLNPLQPLYPHHYRIFIGPTGIGKTREDRLAQKVIFHAMPECVIPNDFSREALYDQLAEQPFAYLGIDEFKGLEARLRRDYNSGSIEFLTEAFDSPPLIRRRTKSSGVVECRTPRITLTAGSTREWFESVTREGDFEGGWLSRFLFICAETMPPLQRPKVLDTHDAIEELAQHAQVVARLSGPADFSAVEGEAWPYLERVHSQISQVDSQLRGFWSRIGIHACKLAMLFHVSEAPADLEIQPGDWSRAVLLMDIVSTDVRQLVAQISFTPSGKGLNKLRRLIPRDGTGIDKRRLLQQSHMKADEFNGYLKTLVQTGEVHDHKLPNYHGPPTTMVFDSLRCQQCPRDGHKEPTSPGSVSNPVGS